VSGEAAVNVRLRPPIFELMSSPSMRPAANREGLVAYWRFDNDALDSTANNNDLTAAGTPVFSTTVNFTADCAGELGFNSFQVIGYTKNQHDDIKVNV